jgi:hypothetical protein
LCEVSVLTIEVFVMREGGRWPFHFLIQENCD